MAERTAGLRDSGQARSGVRFQAWIETPDLLCDLG